ncbi:MAG: sulfatase, partial [Acidobacteriota bacterium]|nr:sulfatase [Acidobacteriota bacterium]
MPTESTATKLIVRLLKRLPRLTGAGFLALTLACAGPGVSDPPNVVVIVIDTLRADHLTQYGYERDTSPALAGLTAEATQFTRAYSTSSWTMPGVASLMTGLLPARHGVVRQSMVLPTRLGTLAEALGEAGWRTGGFSGNLFIGRKTGFDRGFETFEDHDGRVLAYPDAEAMLGQVVDWLQSPAPSDAPFFLYFQPMNCHGPYRVPAERRSDLLGREPGAEFAYQGGPMKAILKQGNLRVRQQVTPAYLQSLTDQYDTAIRYSVNVVERLFDELRTRDLYRNSLIIVTSDHGEELFDHGGFSHAYSLFEEVVRVPLWIKLPHQSHGAAVDLPTSLVDLHPTILETVGIDPPPAVDGLSLGPVLRNETSLGEFRSRALVFDTQWTRRAVASAILLGPYKLIEVDSNYEGLRNARFLFDLDQDPRELNDLAEIEPETTEALATRLQA